MARRSTLTVLCAAILQASVVQHFHHRLLIVIQSVNLQSHETHRRLVLQIFIGLKL
jgi:hypothetical protein